MMLIRWTREPGLADWATGTLTFCSACVLESRHYYPNLGRRRKRMEDRCIRYGSCLLTRNPCGVRLGGTGVRVRGRCRSLGLDRWMCAKVALIVMVV